ncbi:MAG: carboxylating nicotinate-nucleotide diphosphorylase [Proteobacteria bacterium]|nr:carboxylating nicotinate-nucleotide diphosphorylase [Pseudomonadota bacterium]
MPLVERALAEDVGPGDVTSRLAVPESATGTAQLELRAPAVVCGLPIARAVFDAVDSQLVFTPRVAEGARTDAPDIAATVAGSLRSILAAERTALNFLGRLMGIATTTRGYVEAVAGTETAIVDTRKTLPGWRVLDKYACAVGGAVNHRHGLYDGILLKDNHLAAAGGVEAAVKAAVAGAPAGLRVQVEVESLAQAEAALAAGADFLLLDNRTPEELREFVARFGSRATLEASGGITLSNVRAVADTGVHRVSIGALTHSAPACDVALEISPGGVRA